MKAPEANYNLVSLNLHPYQRRTLEDYIGATGWSELPLCCVLALALASNALPRVREEGLSEPFIAMMFRGSLERQTSVERHVTWPSLAR